MDQSEKSIIVKPSVNIESSDSSYWKNQYCISPLKVFELKDISVTYSGLCIRNNELIQETVQEYHEKVRNFELQGKLELLNTHSITLDNDEIYLVIHHPWLNYYHWITESLPKLWLILDTLESLVLLLPHHYKDIPFVLESLHPFRFKNIQYIQPGKNYMLKNVIIPQIKRKCWGYDPKLVSRIREFYREFASPVLKRNIDFGPYIYVARGQSKRRRIVNEEDVTMVLESYGFCSIDAASFSFFEQVAFSEKTKCLISNGSGLTNMHFMNCRTSVLELYKKKTNPNDFHDRVLWYLASALDIDYFMQCCDPVVENEDMYVADLIVDLDQLSCNTERMLKEQEQLSRTQNLY